MELTREFHEPVWRASDERSRSAPPEASCEPEQPFYDGSAHDDITCPMSEKDNSREHQTASDCPDGATLCRWQHGCRRCQGADMDGVSGGKGIEPLSGQGNPMQMPERGQRSGRSRSNIVLSACGRAEATSVVSRT
jgi:hypothetical protein